MPDSCKYSWTAWVSRFTAASMVAPFSWAPATAKCPPPPSFSRINCTLISPRLRPEMLMAPSRSASTKDAWIPLMEISSSAAWAAIRGE